MSKSGLCIAILVFGLLFSTVTHAGFETDVIETSGGKLHITFIGHGTLMFTFGGKVIHVDPVSREADYSKMPKADLILITHEHFDHCSPEDVKQVSGPQTVIVANVEAAKNLRGDVRVLRPGEQVTVGEVKVEAVPAYNVNKFRSPGNPFHPKEAEHVGYIVTVVGERL